MARQSGVRFRRPGPIPLEWGFQQAHIEDAEALVHSEPILEASQQDWDHAMEWGDEQWAYDLFSEDLEMYLHSRGAGSTYVPPYRRGRGKARLEKRDTLPPQTTEESGAQTCKQHRLQKILRKTEELIRAGYFRGQEALASSQSMQTWAAIKRECGTLLPTEADGLPEAIPPLLEFGQLVGRLRQRNIQEQQAVMNSRQ